IRVLDMPLAPEWSQPAFGDWKQGNVTLEVTSPSFAAVNDEFLKALAELGLLRSKPGLYAALSIDRSVVTFTKARWSKVGDDAVRLTLHADDIVGAQARLDAVDGDSAVFLLLQCAQEKTGTAYPDENKIFELGPEDSKKLVAETRRQFALRLPVRPTS